MLGGDLFDCKKCRVGHWCDEDFRWPASRGPAPQPILIIKDVIESRTCFLPMVTDLSRELLHARGHYHNRMMPFPGAALEQPALFLQALSTIDNTVAEIEREKTRGKRGRR